MRSSKYISQFFSRKCAKDVLPYLPNKINLKEITEVMGMWWFVYKDIVEWKPNLIFDVGSGKYSTLGVFVAFNRPGGGFVHSIDPRSDLMHHQGIRHYIANKATLKSLTGTFPKYNRVMVLCNHSHVEYSEVLEFLSGFDDWIFATNPCCHDNRIPNVVCEHKYDTHIWSEKNNLYKYRSKNG